MSVDAEVRRVQGGQAVTVKKSIFFSPNGRMVVHFTHPEEYFLITNRFGEARIFNPQTNEVMVINDRSLSSDVIPLFYFLNNQTTDLGLRDLGFTLTNTRRDGNFLIRTFTPPAQLRANLSRVEIVHENHLPIFVAHYNTNNQIVRRMFFSNYERFNALSLPQRITEITNISPTDSIVSRLLYSNIKVGADATSPKFNFTIPSDARVVDESLLRQPFSGR
ncbi:MAG: hypothetical protein FWD02_05540 [Bacteroidales bacterium]|nr:hypothetical protein [Bacteroidales bacterium]